MQTVAAPGLVVLDPTASPTPKPGSRAARLESLEGKRIGFVDNSKRNADRVLQLLDQMLHERYQTGESVTIRKESASRIVSEEQVEELLGRIDAVIPGVGD